jgi:hypothetical protein
MRWTKKRAVIVGVIWTIALGIWGFIWLDAQTPAAPPEPARITSPQPSTEQEKAATDPTPTVEPTTATVVAAPEPPAVEPPSPSPSGASNAYYANCDAARAAGVAPIYAGQPGYRPTLDRDGDGVACE